MQILVSNKLKIWLKFALIKPQIYFVPHETFDTQSTILFRSSGTLRRTDEIRKNEQLFFLISTKIFEFRPCPYQQLSGLKDQRQYLLVLKPVPGIKIPTVPASTRTIYWRSRPPIAGPSTLFKFCRGVWVSRRLRIEAPQSQSLKESGIPFEPQPFWLSQERRRRLHLLRSSGQLLRPGEETRRSLNPQEVLWKLAVRRNRRPKRTELGSSTSSSSIYTHLHR